MAKLVYSGSLLVDLFNRPLKKLVDSAHCRCTGHWNDKHLTVPPTQRGKKNTSKEQNGEKADLAALVQTTSELWSLENGIHCWVVG